MKLLSWASKRYPDDIPSDSSHNTHDPFGALQLSQSSPDPLNVLWTPGGGLRSIFYPTSSTIYRTTRETRLTSVIIGSQAIRLPGRTSQRGLSTARLADPSILQRGGRPEWLWRCQRTPRMTPKPLIYTVWFNQLRRKWVHLHLPKVYGRECYCCMPYCAGPPRDLEYRMGRSDLVEQPAHRTAGVSEPRLCYRVGGCDVRVPGSVSQLSCSTSTCL